MSRKAKVGDIIRIVKLDDPYEKDYVGRVGKVEYIDSVGDMHGSWGSLKVIPEVDEFQIIGHED